MRFFYGFVVCFLSWSVSLASVDTYRAGVIGATTSDGDLSKFVPLIQEAGKTNVDILVLPSPQISSFETSNGINNYDELVQTLSEASKQAGLYVVAHLLLEKTRCNGMYEMIRSNLVFDRDGNVVSVYRKPVNNVANCTTADTEIATFTTDFGVKFGLLMDEDLVLQKIEDLKGLKNFVVAGAWSSDIPFLSVPQFASTWAFTNEVNLVSSSGIFLGKNGAKSALEAGVTVVDLKKTEGEDSSVIPPVVSSSNLKVFPGEDLSQYIIRPLDVAASASGYKETVCHFDFCCEFFIKTSFIGHKDDVVNYGLAAFNGIRHFGKYNVGTQMCSIFACAGLYKRTCALGSNSNSTNVVFENISIRSNFTSETSQYPIILTTGSQVESDMFNFENRITENQRQVTLEVSNVEDVLSFGIFGRDFSKDSEKVFVIEEELSFKDEIREMCDYLWIRLRILIVVVSIYFLEMM